MFARERETFHPMAKTNAARQEGGRDSDVNFQLKNFAILLFINRLAKSPRAIPQLLYPRIPRCNQFQPQRVQPNKARRIFLIVCPGIVFKGYMGLGIQAML